MAAFGAYARPNPEALEAMRIRAARDMQAQRLKAGGDAAMAGQLFQAGEAEKARGHQMSMLGEGQDFAGGQADLSRGFAREMGATGFGQQKEMVGMASKLGETRAAADQTRDLIKLREGARLGEVSAGATRTHDVDMFGREADLRRDLSRHREVGLDTRQAANLDWRTGESMASQLFAAGEGGEDRASRERIANANLQAGLFARAGQPSAGEKTYQGAMGTAAARFGVPPDALQSFLALDAEARHEVIKADPKWARIAEHYDG